MKGSRLCQSEMQARDALLTPAGGVPALVTAEQARDMARVYRKYRFD